MDHFAVDVVWTEIGRETGCLEYLPGTVIEHLHPLFGKSPDDQLYHETWHKWWDSDARALQAWRAGRKEADKDIVRQVLEAARAR